MHFPVLGRVLSCLAETRKWGLRNNIKVIVVLIFSLITQSITVSEAQSPNVIGTWNVEITFANDEHRSVPFDARADGKGSLVAADPRSRVWDGSKASEAKWNQGEEKLDNVLGRGGVPPRQCRARRGNFDVQRKI